MNRNAIVPSLLALAALGCAIAGTGGREVEITIEIAPEPIDAVTTVGDAPFVVEMLEAQLVVGAIYLFPPRPRSTSLLDLVRPARALAHAGDDNEAGTNAIAEHLDQHVVDAARPDVVDLGPTLAEASRVDRASVLLDHPRGALATLGADGPTRGHLAWVRARATRGTTIVEVEAGLDIPNTPLRRRVDEIPPESARSLERGVRVVLGVRASEWLREVDFAALVPEHHDPAHGAARVVVSAPSQLHGAWQLALTRPQAFALRIEEVSP
ncbi:hypothetical protein [Sandaracinus amylolyticus]|uniref:Secreted protein n=1 Tax=Sandaracinus amylolyticus TaxID=927083 RepID=A0A0F6SE20_9BACT|nr:hypothetical protein [Sandaracinus amylolyticus]AKF04429.1 hypothetical protein DB32_001578 [Sandaracinus amylolyticus]